MGICHSDLPQKYEGEKKLARQLSSMPDDRLHLWFGVNGIPGVRDIDIIIWHEISGIFVVEVKAIPLQLIETYSFNKCIIKGRDGKEAAHVQAWNAMFSLKNFLGTRWRKSEHIGHTACYPKISREEWKLAWGNNDISEQSNSLIFYEDISQGSEAFVERLNHIRQYPPSNVKRSNKFFHDAQLLKVFTEAIDPNVTKKEIPSDLNRLRVLSDGYGRLAISQVKAQDRQYAHYSGFPGTGKTFLMLKIGLDHALKGRRVLFLCYNKVLASDIRRLLSQSRELQVADSVFDVFDAFDLVGRFSELHNCHGGDGDHDAWAINIVQGMIVLKDSITPYDTLLVDEAQDMKPWMFMMLEAYSQPASTWCVAAGKGQELYGDESEWLRKYKTKIARTDLHELRRCFRNTKSIFQVSHTFYENAPEESKIDKTLSKFVSPAGSSVQLSFEFDRTIGNPPSLFYVDDRIEGEDPSTVYYAEVRKIQLVKQYEEIIREQLERLRENEFPIDLLILVPSESSEERNFAFEALEIIRREPPRKIDVLDFIDYTVDEQRRFIASRNQIRLCTFHSARGIEAHRVVLFGFEKIQKIVSGDLTKLRNLGYIVLSRSLFEIIIVVPKSRKPPVINFLIETLRQMREMKDAKPVQTHKETRLMEDQKNSSFHHAVQSGTEISPKRDALFEKLKASGNEKQNVFVADSKIYLKSLRALLEDPAINQRERLEKITSIDAAAIRGLSLQDRMEFVRLLRHQIKSPKIKKERDAFIELMT